MLVTINRPGASYQLTRARHQRETLMQTQSFTVHDEMPAWIDARNAHLNRAARECYALRNAADTDRAGFYEEMGDVFLYRAIALTEEWS